MARRCVAADADAPDLRRGRGGGGAEPDHWIESKAAQDRAQLLGKTLYHQGDLSYFEAVNKETLRNAYQRFAEDGIIEGNARRARLRRASHGRVAAAPGTRATAPSCLRAGCKGALAEAISQSRREGKNRRDGGTVLSRVLKLVDVVGGALWEDGKGGREEGAGKKRRRSIQAEARL